MVCEREWNAAVCRQAGMGPDVRQRLALARRETRRDQRRFVIGGKNLDGMQ